MSDARESEHRRRHVAERARAVRRPVDGPDPHADVRGPRIVLLGERAREHADVQHNKVGHVRRAVGRSDVDGDRAVEARALEVLSSDGHRRLFVNQRLRPMARRTTRAAVRR